MNNKWSPIETAPHTGEEVILSGKSKKLNRPLVGFGHWFRFKNAYLWDSFFCEDEAGPPIYWMPLPEPPDEE